MDLRWRANFGNNRCKLGHAPTRPRAAENTPRSRTTHTGGTRTPVTTLEHHRTPSNQITHTDTHTHTHTRIAQRRSTRALTSHLARARPRIPPHRHTRHTAHAAPLTHAPCTLSLTHATSSHRRHVGQSLPARRSLVPQCAGPGSSPGAHISALSLSLLSLSSGPTRVESAPPTPTPYLRVCHLRASPVAIGARRETRRTAPAKARPPSRAIVPPPHLKLISGIGDPLHRGPHASLARLLRRGDVPSLSRHLFFSDLTARSRLSATYGTTTSPP